jgi:hypothetical protein
MILQAIEKHLFRRVGGKAKFIQGVGDLLQRSVAHVIDEPNTGRKTLKECEKTEKTYLGTKVEFYLRAVCRNAERGQARHERGQP